MTVGHTVSKWQSWSKAGPPGLDGHHTPPDKHPLGSTPSILPGASTENLSPWTVGATARVFGPHDLKQEQGQVLASA